MSETIPDSVGDLCSSPEERHELLLKVLKQLKPHFSTIQIVATIPNHEDDSITRHHVGHGNIFARAGSVHAWLYKTMREEK